MSLVDDVSAQLKDAMRARDKVRVQALRNIRAGFIQAMKAEGADGSLSDSDALAMLRSLAKQRRESIDAYQKGGRDDLVEAEQAELVIIEDFLPKLADEATTRAWVEQAISASGATSPGDMGKVMGHLMKHHKDELDGKLANKLVREQLQG
jgi:hypothetical protein